MVLKTVSEYAERKRKSKPRQKWKTILQTYYRTARTVKHLSGKGQMARLSSRARHINVSYSRT